MKRRRHGVILTDNVSDNACGFHVRAIEGVVLLIHRVEHTTMDWLQSVLTSAVLDQQ